MQSDAWAYRDRNEINLPSSHFAGKLKMKGMYANLCCYMLGKKKEEEKEGNISHCGNISDQMTQ